MGNDWLAAIGATSEEFQRIVDSVCTGENSRHADEVFSILQFRLTRIMQANHSKFKSKHEFIRYVAASARRELWVQCKAAARQKQLDPEALEQLLIEPSPEYDGPTASEILDALRDEPDLLRVVQLLLDGHKPPAIAQALGLPGGSVYRRIAKIRQKLLVRLRHHF